MELLAKAIAINPGYAFAYYVKGTVLWLTKEYPEALAAAETEVGLPSQFSVRVFRDGPGGSPAGRARRSIAHTKQAFA